jgi:hypothetical protein
MMGMDRFRELLDAYGAEPGRWPAKERGPAEVLLTRNTEAARLRSQAAVIDALLDRATLAPPVIDAERLIASITAEPQPMAEPKGGTAEIVTLRPVRRPPAGGFWLKVASLAAAAAIGFLVGVSQLTGLGDPTAPTSGVELADISPW